jgi:hypothetical protein
MCGGANGLIWRSSRDYENPANGSGYRKFRRIPRGRLLLLLKAAAGRGPRAKPLEGIMKLAKMDFLLRYPNILVRALNAIGESKKSASDAAATIPEQDRDTIEAHMIRFRFGPWDPRYRKWLSILVAKQLAIVYLEGKNRENPAFGSWR